MAPKPVSRRDFVASGTTVALGALVAPPMIVPRHVLGRGFQAPSDTLNIAYVGVGGMGMENWRNCISQNTAAVCDVDFAYVEKSLAEQVKTPGPITAPANISAADAPAWIAKRTAEVQARYQNARTLQEHYTRAPKYADYREMLDKEKGIDAVVIATPDHMHAMIALAAMRAGKHVYAQKPLTYSVAEARAVARVARESKVVTQMGNQGHSSEGTARIREVIASGVLGHISLVHVWTDRPHGWWPQGVARPKPAVAPSVPDRLSWDLWLGCVPAIPYDPAYHPFAWRGWVDFGVSALGDMGAHLLDQPFWSLGLDLPTSITSSSTQWGGDAKAPASYPLASTVQYQFPAHGTRGPVELRWYDGGLLPPRPAGLPDDVVLNGDGGGIFVGSRGLMVYDTYGTNPRVFPASTAAAAAAVPKRIARITTSHEQNWFDACKGKGTSSAPFEYSARLTETMLLGLVALRAGQGRTIHYDAANMRVTNAPEANAFLTREYRAGYGLEGP